MKEFARNRTANMRTGIPTANLAPGQYLLKLDAELEARSVERTVRLSIY